MEKLAYRTKISVLWIFMAVAMSAHSVFAFMDPKAVAQMKEMHIGPMMFLFMALFWIVPLIMAFLSITLKDTAGRWVNIILGLLFTVFNLFHFFEHLAQPSIQQIVIIGSTVVVTALISFYAIKWPKQVA